MEEWMAWSTKKTKKKTEKEKTRRKNTEIFRHSPLPGPGTNLGIAHFGAISEQHTMSTYKLNYT